MLIEYIILNNIKGSDKCWLPCGSDDKDSACNAGDLSSVPESGSPWRRAWLPTPVGFLDSSAGKESTCDAGDAGLIPGLGRSPGEGIFLPGQKSLASPWGRKELDRLSD